MGEQRHIRYVFNDPVSVICKIVLFIICGILVLKHNIYRPRDIRYQVLHSNSGEDASTWALQIRNIQQRDAGRYECQINTEPKPKSHIVNVKVVTGHVWILPSDPVVHVGTGGQLNLDCVVDTGPVEPQFILWYRDDRIIEYSDNVDAKVIFLYCISLESSIIHPSLYIKKIQKFSSF